MRKSVSLKRRMFALLTIFILAVLLTGISNTVTTFRGSSHLDQIYALFTSYTTYDDAVYELQNAVANYFIFSSSENHTALIQTADALDDLALQMESLAENVYFTDMRCLTETYTEQVREYVNGNTEYTVESIQHMGSLLLLQYDMLVSYINDIVDTRIVENTHIWQFQLFITLFTSIAMLIYTLLTGLHLSKQIIQPVSTLTRSIRLFKDGVENIGQYTAMPFESCYDEMLLLHDSYLEMADTISRQIVELEDKIRLSEQLRKKEAALSNAEFGLMQSLINPHFLYNCLSTISSLSTIEHAPRTYKSSVMIASFLRKSLAYVGQQITVWEEINYTQQYIEIQKLRFADTIAFSIVCAPECAELKIPAILLQPLIENAIQHGVKSMGSGARISVDVRQNGTKAELLVTDNGSGISPEKLQELTAILQSDYEPGQKGVGLRSIAYRLRAIWGAAAGISIESSPKHTEVKVIIPFVSGPI